MRAIVLFSVMSICLAACASPREQCQADATRDLRNVQALISETEANLRRGYGYEEVQRTRQVRRSCFDDDGDRYTCYRNRTYTERRVIPIDLDEQRRILAQLRQTEQRLAEDTRSELAFCERLPAE